MKQFCYEKLSDPRYFKEGCVPARSDHRYYRNKGEAESEESSFIYSLNGLWKFHYAKNYEATIPGFEKEEYSCKSWDMIRVPAHIQMEGYDKPQYVNVQYPWEGHEDVPFGESPKEFNPTASYVKYFYVPEHMKNERLFLCFEGAESAMAVWLNGEFIGYHEDSFTRAEFELTEHIKDGENKLAVQVFKWCSGSWCEDQDFFRFSGLYRDVYLYSEPEVHVRDMAVTAVPSDDLKTGELSVKLSLTNEGKTIIRLKSGDEEIVKKESESGGNTVVWDYSLNEPKLWSAEEPFLYDLFIEVYDKDGNLKECIAEKIGFRRFEIVGGIMRLNGKRIVFNGADRHDFSSLTGRNISKEETVKDIKVMKRYNINAVRTSHYPNSSDLYRLCDEYGIYLIDEMNLETHGTWDWVHSEEDKKFIIPKDKEEWELILLDRAANMYERDKNHASVLIWSCGNESYGGKVIYEVSKYFKSKDNTRLVHYEGINNDRSYPATSDMESRMYVPVKEIREYLKEHRDKPYICCEYAHAMGNSCGALHKYIELSEEEELYQGGFIWDYIDQSIEKKDRYGKPFQAYGGDFYDRPTDYNFSGNGIVYGEDREPSPKMQEVKFLYQNIKITVKKTEVEIYNKNLFVNTNVYECLVTLEKEGKKLCEVFIETDVKPGEKKTYKLPFEARTSAGEYVITVSFLLKEDTIWAERGYEVAFGQFAYENKEEKTEILPPVRIIKSSHNIGVKGEDFEVLFSLSNGGLVSYKYGGVEMLERMPKPNFWRAPTDNDCGNLMQARYGQWKIASLYANVKKVTENLPYITYIPHKTEEKEDSVKITFTYALPTTPCAECEVSYEVYGNAKVVTTLSYEPVKGLSDMPEFGMMFTVNADFDNLTWYGLGPDETYADRKHGAKLGVYKNLVKDNMAAYLVPQECGNKEEVRYAEVTDKKGRGLLFEALNENMSFSALPYSPHQLEEAMHPYELPEIHYTYIRVNKAQMGIGGDDSWGARTHEEYLIPVKKKLEFKFSFMGI